MQPGDDLLETAEVVPIKQEGIISNVDLNIDRGIKKLEVWNSTAMKRLMN